MSELEIVIVKPKCYSFCAYRFVEKSNFTNFDQVYREKYLRPRKIIAIEKS